MGDEAYWDQVRAQFPCLHNNDRYGKPPIYFDNACMTLKPKCVIDAMNEYYNRFPACGGHGRADHWWSQEVNSRVEKAREDIRELIHANSKKEIIFTKNTTEAINLVANALRFQRGDVVLITGKEHNSNLLPWQALRRRGVKVDIVKYNNNGTFSLETFRQILARYHQKVKIVSIVHTSNLDGYTIPDEDLGEVVGLAHSSGARVLLDGAQSVPHRPINVRTLGIDFLAFSIHKMCGPNGVGVLYANEEMFDEMHPWIVGGGTVRSTHYHREAEWDDPPEKFEAGLQNYSGIIGAGEAARFLNDKISKIPKREYELNAYLTSKFSDLRKQYDFVEIEGPEPPELRGGILCFHIKKYLKPKDENQAKEFEERFNIGKRFDGDNIMVRMGYFCVHSCYNDRFKHGWPYHFEPIRVSLYFYNNTREIDVFADNLGQVLDELSSV